MKHNVSVDQEAEAAHKPHSYDTRAVFLPDEHYVQLVLQPLKIEWPVCKHRHPGVGEFCTSTMALFIEGPMCNHGVK